MSVHLSCQIYKKERYIDSLKTRKYKIQGKKRTFYTLVIQKFSVLFILFFISDKPYFRLHTYTTNIFHTFFMHEKKKKKKKG